MSTPIDVQSAVERVTPGSGIGMDVRSCVGDQSANSSAASPTGGVVTPHCGRLPSTEGSARPIVIWRG